MPYGLAVGFIGESRFEHYHALPALGAVVTTCYIVGLLARRERKVLGLGPDSLVVLLTYIGGVLLLTYVPG